jgi:hypothetical protein
MKISTKLNDVEMSNVSDGTKYGFEDSPIAAHVLTSNIYSHHRRIEAVLRESSTNAQDSMEAAGRGTQPITVHLPTAIEPWLSIEDRGLGLNPKDVTTLFGTFFMSLSAAVKKANGYFGVGSKSPFSYTSMFTVEAFKDGVRSLYQCYKDADDQPSMLPLAIEETTQPNGLIVTIPVEADDIDQFAKDAIKLYQHFSVLPVFVGRDITDHIQKIREQVATLLTHKGKGWSFYKATDSRKDVLEPFDNHFNHLNGNSVVMGSVSYPLDLGTLLKSKFSTLGAIDLSNIQGLVLELDIEKTPVNIETGREKLQYSELTCMVLSEKINEVIRYSKDFFDSISKNLSDWEMRALIFDKLKGDSLLSIAMKNSNPDALSYANFSSKFNAEIKSLSVNSSKHTLKTFRFGAKTNSSSRTKTFQVIQPTSRIRVIVKNITHPQSRSAQWLYGRTQMHPPGH